MAVFELVLAKIMLAILFSTAPLFISFTLFKVTQGFFDRWLGACAGFGLLMIFVSSMLALALSIAQWAIADIYISHAVGLSLVGFVPVMIIGFIGVGILLKASQLAQSIGGTITTVSGSSLLAGVIGGAIGSSLSALKLPGSALGATKNLFSTKENNSKPSRSAMNAIHKDLIKPTARNPENKNV